MSLSRLNKCLDVCILLVAVALVLGCTEATDAQQIPRDTLENRIDQYRGSHEKEVLGEFVQLLSIPNHASDNLGIERNAKFIQKMLESRGITVRLLRVAGFPPVVYGELRAGAASAPTVGIYAHYDGQPVDAAAWLDPPFRPVVRDDSGREVGWETQARLDPHWRIYARSASDDKAPIESTMVALDALRSSHIPVSANLKFLFEGEEEAGSPHLAQILSKSQEALQADVWLLCDGPVHQSGRMQVFFGARGTTDLEITVYGPARALHSGHYGNWAPNPIVLLTRLLDSMRDLNAQILIPGFYDDVRPLTPSERHALSVTPAVEDQLKHELAIAQPEGDGAPLAEQILKPAINVRGIQAGYVGGQAANVISTEARASLDFRLVPDQRPERVRQEVESHIAQQGFFIVHDTPDLQTRGAHARVVKLEWGAGYPAYRTSVEGVMAQALVRTIELALGGPVIQVVSLGGSVPMYLLETGSRTPVIGVPIANYDNNQHAANENLRLQNLWEAIDIYAELFAKLADQTSRSAPSMSGPQ